MGEQDDRKDQQITPAAPSAASFTKNVPATVTVDVPPIPAETLQTVEFSNSIRLTIGQWAGVGVFAVLLFCFAPSLWKTVEPFPLEPDYRMPHTLGNDYWLYERYTDLAVHHYDTLIIGDSVVWGEYVTRQQTLSHYLNEQAGRERAANLGLDGADPLALWGLVEHYAGSVRGKNVVLECNPLWLSSPARDLQDDKEVNKFNHPNLVPQFTPRIPAYKKEISPRLGVVVEQHTPLSRWTNHLQQAYYGGSDLPAWTLEHPYDNPIKPLTRGLPPSDKGLQHLSEPPQVWYKKGISELDYPWIDLPTSLQWHAFQQIIQVLQQRGNRVFVLVGPFNEHLLNAESKQRYQEIKAEIAAWLEAQQLPHAVPEPLPSELYGDASHPLAAGYELLARQLLKEPFFQADEGSR